MANPEQAVTRTPATEPGAQARRVEGRPFQLRPYRIFLYLVLIFGGLAAVLPFFWMLSSSLMTLGETINRQWLPAAPQFQNYVEAWNQAKFARYFTNSVIITAITCLGLVTTSVLAGYAFARIRFFGRDVIFAVLISTLMIPEFGHGDPQLPADPRHDHSAAGWVLVEQPGGADDAIYGQRLQHLPAAPVLRAGAG